jgi:hypothetical protein
LQDPISKNPLQNKAGGVVVGPEFKPWYHTKKVTYTRGWRGHMESKGNESYQLEVLEENSGIDRNFCPNQYLDLSPARP